jgi:hypothetical protein
VQLQLPEGWPARGVWDWERAQQLHRADPPKCCAACTATHMDHKRLCQVCWQPAACALPAYSSSSASLIAPAATPATVIATCFPDNPLLPTWPVPQLKYLPVLLADLRAARSRAASSSSSSWVRLAAQVDTGRLATAGHSRGGKMAALFYAGGGWTTGQRLTACQTLGCMPALHISPAAAGVCHADVLQYLEVSRCVGAASYPPPQLPAALLVPLL